jgi:hypothetical protein
MHKVRIEYDSNLDALVALSKRLSISEKEFNMVSEEFYNKYCRGLLEDSLEFTEWANDYRHYLAIYQNLDKRLQHVA